MKKTIIVLFVISAFFCFVTQTSYAQIRLGASVGLGLPTGDFGDVSEAGFGFQADAKFTVANKVGIGADIGYSSYSTEGDADASFRVVPIRVSGEYFFMAGPVQPFVSGGLGIYVFDIGGDDVNFNIDSETEAGFQFGGGVLAKLANKLNLNATLKFNFIDGGGYIDLRAGVLVDL